MKNSIKIIIAIIVFAAVTVGAVFAFRYLSGKYDMENAVTEVQTTTDVEADAAPDFTVYDGEGNAVSLSSLKGKSVVVNFWADWCPPCVSELPNFQKAYEQYKDVEFLMVNVNSTPQYIDAFAQRNGYSFPIYYDSDGSAYSLFGLSTIPKTLFVDPDGRLIKLQVGMMNELTLNDTIEQIRR